MELVMNEIRKKIVKALESAEKPLTLAEISDIIGEPVKTGTTNAMVKANVIAKVGERTITCSCCGAKRKVSEYTLGTEKVKF